MSLTRRRLLVTALALVFGSHAIAAQGRGRGQAPAPPARLSPRGLPLDLRSPEGINWNLIMFPTQRFADIDKQAKDPVRLFDNVYSVGAETVCAFLVTTSAGHVLIDTTFPETVDMVLDNIRKVGFDPAEIKYVFSTHAANDHYGGAGRIKQVAPGARIGMSLPDWEEVERQMQRVQPGSKQLPFARDLVIEDGQRLTLGDTTFTLYVLPGRTPGALGIEFPARDGGRTYRALANGAYGTPATQWGDAYLKSIARLKTLGPWQVWLPNHPFMALPRDLGEIEQAMKTRGQGPHPAVVTNPQMVDDQLDFIHQLISRKVAIERYQGLR
jgi:metallo-beta-lactamase class B